MSYLLALDVISGGESAVHVIQRFQGHLMFSALREVIQIWEIHCETF